MMKLQSVVMFSILCGLQSAVVLADGSVEEGQAKSTPCIACHGASGNSSNPVWPNLASQHGMVSAEDFERGNVDDDLSSGAQHPIHLIERIPLHLVVEGVEQIEGGDEIELVVGKRQARG